MRGVAPPAHATHATSIIPFTNVTAGDQGAVFVSVQSHGEQPDGPFKSMDEVFTENNLPDQEGISAEARGLDIPFVRVDRTDWGISGGRKCLSRLLTFIADEDTDCCGLCASVEQIPVLQRYGVPCVLQ